MNRTEKFARIFALAHTLGTVLIHGDYQTMDKYRTDMQRKPADTLMRMHTDLANHFHSLEFDGSYAHLIFEMMGEQIASLLPEELTNEPLDDSFFIYRASQAHAARNIMSAKAAGKLWGLSPAYVRNLCADGTVKAVRIGKTWAIPKDHPNPKVE